MKKSSAKNFPAFLKKRPRRKTLIGCAANSGAGSGIYTGCAANSGALGHALSFRLERRAFDSDTLIG
ncbi:hypothetical protein B5F10_09605 [Anaerotruncus colihominis]|uniref:Uncharacterized protein n=1 Tax=Anaerotruncus colihominis TaxID=169435 RepID=A0A1Y4MZ49_9FIRM|nr:hypothetical protein B5F11_10815 [Anaerotruncus colihominis]OUP73946.1 hypothetical protein B5F10_09605 [Anaerotruncus colihominis]